MVYTPGKHLIVTLDSAELQNIVSYQPFKVFADHLVAKYQLQKLGEVYHDFSPQGFTGVVCLSESHLSVHTWPENGKVNLDIYLSNHLRNNDDVVMKIYHELEIFFRGSVVQKQIISR